MNFLLKDPRHFQIAALASLLCFGALALGLPFQIGRAALVVASCLMVQWSFSKFVTGEKFDPRSALITSMSLTLLLRTGQVEFAVIAAFLAIGSKFLLRIRGKHIFNPANFAIVSLMLVSDQVWVSTGQWGNTMLGAVLLGAGGLLVISRARRAETSFAFFGIFAALYIGRGLILGDPLPIALHQLQNGALLVFTFFMISDPRTCPDSARGRLVYGALVALVAFLIETQLFIPAGPIWALAFCAPVVLLIDRLSSGSRYEWSRAAPRFSFARSSGGHQ